MSRMHKIIVAVVVGVMGMGWAATIWAAENPDPHPGPLPQKGEGVNPGAATRPADASVAGRALDEVQRLLEVGDRATAGPLLKQAVLDLQAAVKADPEDAAAHYQLGRGLQIMGHAGPALEQFDLALKLRPQAAAFHVGKAKLLIDMGKGAEAIAEMKKAVELAPAVAEYWVHLGRAYVGLKDLDHAAEAYQKALKLDPTSAMALYYLGVAEMLRGKTDEAIKLFLQAAEADPKLPAPHYNAGQLYQNQGKLKEALAQFKEVVRLMPDDVKARGKLVQLYEALADKPQRDRERAALLELWKSGQSPEASAEKFYCRDQFTAQERKVMVMEHFALEGDWAVRYVFYVWDKGKDEQADPAQKISLGSYKMSDAIAHETGSLKPGERMFHLDAYLADGTHRTYGFYIGEPDYDKVKGEVKEVLAGTKDPVSSSTPGRDRGPEEIRP